MDNEKTNGIDKKENTDLEEMSRQIISAREKLETQPVVDKRPKKKYSTARIHERRQERFRYLLTQRVPIRFGMILVPEVLLSLLLQALVKTGFTSGIYAPLHIIALVGFWIFTYWLSTQNYYYMHKDSHYYICNLCAYALFLLVAFAAFMFNLHSPDFPRDMIYYPCFRLSYIIGLVGDKKINPDELPLSMSVFYCVTFAIIMVVPLVKKIRRALMYR